MTIAKPLDRIGPENVAAWFDAASKERPGAANRALAILRAMVFRAEEWGLRERGTNPCFGLKWNPRKKVARVDIDALSDSRKPEAFLFPRHAGRRGPGTFDGCWQLVRADAGLGRLRLHDLRHTTASQAADGSTRPPATPTLPTSIWSRRRKKWGE